MQSCNVAMHFLAYIPLWWKNKPKGRILGRNWNKSLGLYCKHCIRKSYDCAQKPQGNCTYVHEFGFKLVREGGARPPPHHSIDHHVQSYRIRSGWECRLQIHSPNLFSTPICTLCVQTTLLRSTNRPFNTCDTDTIHLWSFLYDKRAFPASKERLSPTCAQKWLRQFSSS